MALTDELMNKHDIVHRDISGSRKRKLPARLDNTHVDSTLGKSSPVQQKSDLQKLWNDILDKQIMELNTRFKPDKALILPACEHFSVCAAA